LRGCGGQRGGGRTAAINQLKALLVTAPASVREPLDGPTTGQQVQACGRLRPDPEQLANPLQTRAGGRS
jgi:transposase